MGTVIAMPLAGILAQYVSWEAIFYVFGEFVCNGKLNCVNICRTSGSGLVLVMVVLCRGLSGSRPEDHGAGAGVSPEHHRSDGQTSHGRSSSLEVHVDQQTSLGHHHRAFHRELGLLHPADQSANVPERSARLRPRHGGLPGRLPVHPDGGGGADQRIPGRHLPS